MTFSSEDNTINMALLGCAQRAVEIWYSDAVPLINRHGLTETDSGFDSVSNRYIYDHEGIKPDSVTIAADWVVASGLNEIQHHDNVPLILKRLTAAARDVFHSEAVVKHISHQERHKYILCFPPESLLDDHAVEKLMAEKKIDFSNAVIRHFEIA